MQPSDSLGRIDILYTDIGRGHPYYLDGIVQALIAAGQIKHIRNQSSVFELSDGLSLRAWQAADWLYRKGSSSALVRPFYEAVRRGTSHGSGSFGERILGRDLRKRFSLSDNLLVAHPALVGMLHDTTDVLYQHGELVVPDEALVAGARVVFVPTEEAAGRFDSAGYSPDSVHVTGLCVELPLARKADDLFRHRLQRIQADSPLTGAAFSSGAEPRRHCRQLIAACRSAVDVGNRMLLFARRGGRLHADALKRTGDLSVLDAASDMPYELPPFCLILYDNRREENALTIQLFERFDFYVGPSHERTNWGIGLGLPMFITTPTIGPFAPLNLTLLEAHGSGLALDEGATSRFGDLVQSHRQSGRLAQMAESGFGRYALDGFRCIADRLVSRLRDRGKV